MNNLYESSAYIYHKQQTPPPTGCGPYVPNSEKLTTDKASYHIGETLSWTAKNLQIGAQYNVVLATKDLYTWIVPNPFVATSCVKSGQINLSKMMGGTYVTPGQYTLILVKYTPGTQIMSSVSLTSVSYTHLTLPTIYSV